MRLNVGATEYEANKYTKLKEAILSQCEAVCEAECGG